MSQKILKVAVSSLTTLRVTCQKCRCSVDIPMADVGAHLSERCCPVCETELYVKGATDKGVNPFVNIQQAVQAASDMADRVRIEFVIYRQNAEEA